MSNKNARIASSMKATRSRRKSQSARVFQVKVQSNALNRQQSEALKMMFVEAKWLYNDALAKDKPADYVPGKTVQVKTREGNMEERSLRFIGSQMKQSVITGLVNNLRVLSSHKKAGRRVGRLKFISGYDSIDLKQHGTTYQFKGNRAKIQNVPGWVKVRGLNQLEGWELANAKLVSKSDGYYLHVTAYKEKKDIKDSYIPGTVIGLDMGLSTHLSLSDGAKISVTVGESDRLKRLQRKLSKQIKGSNNRHKTRVLLQQEYQKMNNRKNDQANKIVATVLTNERVFMQDENLKAWRKSFGGNKQHHSILGRVKAKLVHHPRVTVLPKIAPTTQLCLCGRKNKHSLSQRVYSCNSCGYTLSRDLHAARNMVRMSLPAERRELTLVESESDWLTLSATQHRSMKQEATSSLD